MNARLTVQIALLTAVVPLACSVEPGQESIDSVDQAIINGTPALCATSATP